MKEVEERSDRSGTGLDKRLKALLSRTRRASGVPLHVDEESAIEILATILAVAET